MLGDSITTDHICPISTIRAGSAAGDYLAGQGVPAAAFNNYGARRMNHEVMLRGGFSNPRLRNRLAPGSEGGVTVHQPSLARMTVFEAAMRYRAEGVPLVVVAGEEYGTGSALGVRAIIAGSFERIHRSNLVGMGVLPCQLPPGTTAVSLGLDGSEVLSITGLDGPVQCGQALRLEILRHDGREEAVPVSLRIDTEAELRYVNSGGMMAFMLGEIMARTPPARA
jgi:aconitate hydratase